MEPVLASRLLAVFDIDVGPPQELGVCPGGQRKNVPVLGGTFEGPRFNGRILPGGGDWAFVRPDGVLELDVRITLETHDGALVYMTYRGIRHGSPEVLARVARGEDVDPSTFYFRVVPVFETSAPAYEFLNRLISVGTGRRKKSGPVYTVHEIL